MIMPGLKKHRILAGLTQEELAERAGIHRVSLAELERSRRQPRPRTLKRLTDVLGVSTHDLAKDGHTGTEKPPSPDISRAP